MAESWGLVIILFFLAAFIVFIIKMFLEFPGLLQLSCVYDDNTKEKSAEKSSDKTQRKGEISRKYYIFFTLFSRLNL